MSLEISRPLYLLLLALVPVAVWLGLRSRKVPPARRRGSVALRAIVMTCLIVALAEPRVVRDVTERSVAFLLDSSLSVPPAERTRGEAFAAAAIQSMPEGATAAVVAFGERALLDRTAREGPMEPVSSVAGSGRTDLAAAVRLGAAALPAESGRRLVVISDGRSNLGNLDAQAELMAAQGVPVDVVPLAAAPAPGETLVAALEAPAASRVGQRFDLTAVVMAKEPGQARLLVSGPDGPLLDEEVQLAAGENRFAVPVTIGEAGFHRYRAVVFPEHDGRAENNEAAAFTVAAGPPKVLVVSQDDASVGSLLEALRTAERAPDVVRPEDVPESLLGLAAYDAVLLVDVPARRLPPTSMPILEAMVRDLGKGLIMIGGSDSFGAGEYKDTPIEKALPVDMEVRDKERRPSIALTFVIDKSGSMAECVACGMQGGPGGMGGGGPAKVDLAIEAVLQAAELVKPEDQLGMTAFDDSAHRIWPLATFDDPDGFASAVSAVAADGGTNIFSGLEAATTELEAASASLKHIILLTDGWSDSTGYDRVIQRMDDAGMTLSIVAVGLGSAPYLADLAEQGGGRYYAVEDPSQIPQILVEETITSLGTFIVEERFQPVPGSRSEILAGLDVERLPPLSGYNATTEKQSARVAMWSHLDDPVLAQWQYGLGRAVAWTSDLQGKWASAWLGEAAFGRFAVQLVDWTLPAPDAEGLDLDVSVRGGRLEVTAHVAGASGVAENLLDVEAVVTGPDGRPVSATLRQTAPGTYAGQLDLAAQGAYLMHVTTSRDGRRLGTRTAGVAVPYSPEFDDPSLEPTDPELFRLAERTGGRVLEVPARAFDPIRGSRRSTGIWQWLLLASTVLFVADVAIRRLKLARSDIAPALGWLRERARPRSRPLGPAAEPVLGSLASARARAATRTRRPVAVPADREAAAPAVPAPDASAEPPQGRPQAPPSGETESPAASDTMSRLRAAKRRAGDRR